MDETILEKPAITFDPKAEPSKMARPRKIVVLANFHLVDNTVNNLRIYDRIGQQVLISIPNSPEVHNFIRSLLVHADPLAK